MFTHFLPWLVAGLATRITVNFLLYRWLSFSLALTRGLAFTLVCLASFASWQFALALPLGLIVGVFLIDLLRGRL